MSQHTARQDSRARSADEDEDEDEAVRPVRPVARGQGVRARRPVGRPGDDDGVTPDEPDEDEFELIGDDDLSAADLGPIAPDARDPDAESGRIRKISR
jgi:hypothetical protein